MPWEKPTEKMIETFAAILPADPRIERRKMFGCPAGFVNGNMFAGLHENRVVLRLPEETREILKKKFHAEPFAPLPGRVMKEWIVLPSQLVDDSRVVVKLTTEALVHAASLPVKTGRAKPRGAARTARKARA